MNMTHFTIVVVLWAGLAMASIANAAQEGFPLLGVEEQQIMTINAETHLILGRELRECVTALRQSAAVSSAFDAFTSGVRPVEGGGQVSYHAVGTPNDRFLLRKCVAERGFSTTTIGSSN
jgi:hypothetical protein